MSGPEQGGQSPLDAFLVHKDNWADRAGRLMGNFNVLEMLSPVYLSKLGKDPMLVEFASRQDFRERIDLICQLLEREGTDNAPATRYEDAWRQVRGLLPWRNQIAHSPFGGFERRDCSGARGEAIRCLEAQEGTVST